MRRTTVPLRRFPTPTRRVVADTTRWIAAAFVIATTFASAAVAQLDRLRKLRGEVKLPSAAISKWFGGDPPLTTSLDDAMNNAVTPLDGFQPATFTPLEEMPLAPGGTFYLAPGAYTFEAETYCLQPGTMGAQRGDGYLYAELTGPKAGLIRNILNRASDHPLVPQTEIQKLLWGILARARVDKMPTAIKATAAEMLTPRELVELSSFGVPAVSDAVRQQVLKGVPAATRQLLEAEDDIRRLMSAAEPRFEDLERVAVLAGAPDPGGEVIPEGRWSYHPNGYFIRYYAITRYSKTRIEIYYPESFQIERDDRGRINSVKLPTAGGTGPAGDAGSPWQLATLRSRPHRSVQIGGLKPYQPGGGGSAAPHGRQRGGASGRSANNNAASQAQQVTSAMSKAAALLGPLTGGLGGGGLPNFMTGQLLNQNFQNAQTISNALGGDPGSSPDHDAGSAFTGVGWGTPSPGALWPAGPRRGRADYTVLSAPIDVTFPPVAPSDGVTGTRAAGINAMLRSSYRLTATLQSIGLARRRFVAAHQAGSIEWERLQAQAVIHLKHEAGRLMVQLANDIESVQSLPGPAAEAAVVTADQVRATQRRLGSEGIPAEAATIVEALGGSDADLARYRSALLGLDPAATAAQVPAALRQLQAALVQYGRRWLAVPTVVAPWR
ncbi:MAG: hypothetical protein ACKVZ0_09605 [Gemmatimonadales bacterium]